ncbi:MAG TPA: response regulator transcription factor [Silvibacterium sp.]|nr:response regulator transcription factor [Silvibacterium sp.]
MRFLIAEDNQALSMFLRRALEADGHEVRLAADGLEAVDSFMEESPDLAILDLSLPRLDGTEVLRRLRSVTEDLPVLILSARNEMGTRLRCLDLGADDCLAKPFAMAELRARIRVLLRRRRDQNVLLRHGSLEVNRVERAVSCQGRAVILTGKEFALLEYLLLHRGRAVSRATLLEQVWKMEPEASSNIVDVYVNYLRRKLGNAGEAPPIQTIRGQGYAIGLRA